jgi:hypothetical protein
MLFSHFFVHHRHPFHLSGFHLFLHLPFIPFTLMLFIRSSICLSFCFLPCSLALHPVLSSALFLFIRSSFVRHPVHPSSFNLFIHLPFIPFIILLFVHSSFCSPFCSSFCFSFVHSSAIHSVHTSVFHPFSSLSVYLSFCCPSCEPLFCFQEGSGSINKKSGGICHLLLNKMSPSPPFLSNELHIYRGDIFRVQTSRVSQ